MLTLTADIDTRDLIEMWNRISDENRLDLRPVNVTGADHSGFRSGHERAVSGQLAQLGCMAQEHPNGREIDLPARSLRTSDQGALPASERRMSPAQGQYSKWHSRN